MEDFTNLLESRVPKYVTIIRVIAVLLSSLLIFKLVFNFIIFVMALLQRKQNNEFSIGGKRNY
jgi:hypothetical protein